MANEDEISPWSSNVFHQKAMRKDPSPQPSKIVPIKNGHQELHHGKRSMPSWTCFTWGYECISPQNHRPNRQ
jgi:hypothetical protein